ncbi:hypothetical protein SAMN05216338_1003325 [Bradyrhizobium sp. Rc2d]|uniref:hypothetical protein n=1 Tax=Bradyrhizobium sp. Rc2d TaxID=1855321 RepID=UPI00087F9315|nr:hypothetical protein [Bradyrhizobium sp. Rc2d]SDG88584.1 hypothetical protein SAMN05216338_1003325 [Bradyrhizobium sp. Rc2d]
MPDNGGWWERVSKELVSPWDWVAAGVGATGGLVVSAALLHTDMGASVGAGALGAVTAKKAGVAACQRPILMRRTRAFIKAIERSLQEGAEGPNPDKLRLLGEVQRDLDLLERKVISAEQYGKILDGYIATFRQMALPSYR